MLTYIGDGTAIIGVPARNLTHEEIAAAGWNEQALIESGLYALVVPAQEKPAPSHTSEPGPSETQVHLGGKEHKQWQA